ncbi:MAG: hypothetical protein L0J45_00750 [Psychroflexus sp.]|nr:hypothetical protein [Psychroflexus sp.]MDN6310314.1 hypothetical protein [Psychroflexus sp.]
MKKLVLTAFFAAVTIGISHANTATVLTTDSYENFIQNQRVIELSEVPQVVQDAFMADGYTEESIVEIHEMTTGESQLEYKFLLEVEGQKAEVTYNDKGEKQ